MERDTDIYDHLSLFIIIFIIIFIIFMIISYLSSQLIRYEAYGWEVLEVEDGDGGVGDIIAKIEAAKSNGDQPTLIKVKTTIG